MRKNHISYYIIESIILGLGFFIVYSLSTINLQIMGIIAVVLIYSVMGLVHHKIDHDMHPKIVLEYIIISVLVVSIFVFLKSSSL